MAGNGAHPSLPHMRGRDWQALPQCTWKPAGERSSRSRKPFATPARNERSRHEQDRNRRCQGSSRLRCLRDTRQGDGGLRLRGADRRSSEADKVSRADGVSRFPHAARYSVDAPHLNNRRHIGVCAAGTMQGRGCFTCRGKPMGSKAGVCQSCANKPMADPSDDHQVGADVLEPFVRAWRARPQLSWRAPRPSRAQALDAGCRQCQH